MRLLTVHGFCDETGVRQYRSNANAELLNTPGMVGATHNMLVSLCGRVNERIMWIGLQG